MGGRSSYSNLLKHWSELESNVATTPELATLEPKRAELETVEKGLRIALDLQAAGKVQMHEATRTIEELVARGNELVVQLHDGIRSHYGRSAEKLGKFRLQPRRPKTASATAKSRKASKKAENKTPSESGPNPTPTATPETDGSTQE